MSPEDWVISRGWAHVWDHVFGWNNATYTRRELEYR